MLFNDVTEAFAIKDNVSRLQHQTDGMIYHIFHIFSLNYDFIHESYLLYEAKR